MIAAALRHMFRAGMSPEDIVSAIEEMETSEPAAKTPRQLRNARYYEANRDKLASERRLKASEPSESVLNQTPSREGAHVEDNLPSKKITGNKEGRKKTPRDELAAVLDAEHADAVIEHRNKFRKPLTAYAAKQLATSLACCPDANAAADTMIESGWLKIKPEWLESRTAQRATAPPAARGVLGAAKHIIESRTNGPEIFPRNRGHVEQLSTGPGDRPGAVVEDIRSGIGRRFGAGSG